MKKKSSQQQEYSTSEYVEHQYELGLLSDKDVRNLAYFEKKHPGSTDLFGSTIQDYYMAIRLNRGNTSVVKFFENAIEEWKVKSKLSSDQNALNQERLKCLEYNACGIGLKKVIREMKYLCRCNRHNLQMNITYLFLCLEWANQNAKRYCGELREVIYERKNYLMKKLAPLLKKAGYRHGLSYNTGKNASYVLYCYLPNGDQVSWHTQWNMYDVFLPINVEWDHKPATTMVKIINYINEQHYIN